MFVAVKRPVILRDKSEGRKLFLPFGFVGEIDDDFDTAYFRALVKDGDIAIPETHKDKDVVPELEKPVKTKRKKD